MAQSGYKTIRGFGTDEFVERKSRFIGSIQPVSTEEEAVAFIQSVKERHREANHNVYAYVLREGQIRRYSDDGDPRAPAACRSWRCCSKRGWWIVVWWSPGTLAGCCWGQGAWSGLFPRRKAGGGRRRHPEYATLHRAGADYGLLPLWQDHLHTPPL